MVSTSPHVCSPWGSVKVDLWVCGAIGWGALGAVFYATAVDDADSPVANHNISRQEV